MRHVLHGLMGSDYFAFFGLEKKLSLDQGDLEQRFYRLSRKLHPDRYLRATPADRQQALDASAALNDAYRTLRDPVARAEYFLGLNGIPPGAQQAPPELLEEVFELNLALEEARSHQVEAFRNKFRALLSEADDGLERLFPECDRDRQRLGRLRDLLNRRKYLAKLLAGLPTDQG